MPVSFADVSMNRCLDLSVESLFAHWSSPETRRRREVGPDTGMRYEAFDTREGGVERVIVTH